MTVSVRMRLLPHAQSMAYSALPFDPFEPCAGFDLIAAVPADAPIIIVPGQRAAIPTGLYIELPPDTEAQVRPRAGLALWFGVTVLDAPSTVDVSYHGEIHVILINLGGEPFTVERGMRIAKLVFAPVLALQSEWAAPA